MIETASVHTMQITREVQKDANGATAIFLYTKTNELLCAAWFSRPDFRKIRVQSEWMTIERSSAISIAINMAIDWLAEQS